MYVLKKIAPLVLMAGLSGVAFAKLPAPSDEAKAKAAETAAKAVWTGKVDTFLLCKSQDQVAAKYYKTSAASGKTTKPAATTAPCADPGAFVYTPGAPVTVTTPAVAAVPATANSVAVAAVPATTATVSAAAAAASAPAKTIEAAGAHSPTATAAAPPSGKQTDAVVNPAKKP